MHALTVRWALLLPVLCLLAVSGSASAQRLRPSNPVTVEIKAQRILSFDPRDPARKRFGALEFRGGLELSSTDKNFGGLSALHVEKDGAGFVALSDRAWWVRGRIAYTGPYPAGITDTEMAPVLGLDGRTLKARGWSDTEAMTFDRGVVYVGIERVNRILRFDFGRDGLGARGRPLAVPPEVSNLPFNKGIEGLVQIARGPLSGTLIAFSERGLDADGNILAFLIGGRRPGLISVRRSGEYDVTDAAVLPDGDILLLERRFSYLSGAGMRIRRIALSTVEPGAVLDGPVMIEADLGYQIDNMEGLAVHRTTAGETVLTLVSDDNFSVLQRTLLLQFSLVEH